ncbi:MAG: hypothetical protein ACHQ51_11850 [Elusimicrobiota bacterium]
MKIWMGLVAAALFVAAVVPPIAAAEEVTDQQIQDFVKTHNEQEILAAMNQYGVTADRLAHVLGISADALNADAAKAGISQQAVNEAGTGHTILPNPTDTTITINGKVYTAQQIKDFYAQGGDDAVFVQGNGITDPVQARDFILKARAIGGVDLTGDAGLQHYFALYSKSTPNGAHAHDYAGWLNDQQPAVQNAMRAGAYTGASYDPADYDFGGIFGPDRQGVAGTAAKTPAPATTAGSPSGANGTAPAAVTDQQIRDYANTHTEKETLAAMNQYGVSADRLAGALNISRDELDAKAAKAGISKDDLANAGIGPTYAVSPNAAGGNAQGGSNGMPTGTLKTQGGQSVTHAQLVQFMATKPTDQQILAQASKWGMSMGDVNTALNNLGLLFNNGNPTSVQMNDPVNGSIYNRLSNEVYRGDLGYGANLDTSGGGPNINTLITAGNGHTWIDDGNGSGHWQTYGSGTTVPTTAATTTPTTTPTVTPTTIPTTTPATAATTNPNGSGGTNGSQGAQGIPAPKALSSESDPGVAAPGAPAAPGGLSLSTSTATASSSDKAAADAPSTARGYQVGRSITSGKLGRRKALGKKVHRAQDRAIMPAAPAAP